MKKPLDAYLACLKESGYYEDSAQRLAIDALNEVYEREEKKAFRAKGRSGFLARWFGMTKPDLPGQSGLYLWGGVGRGKTFMMDIFYSCLPGRVAQRIHFHRFMREVHAELKNVRGQAEPLAAVAEKIHSNGHILCLDEFLVNDIADAMLLAGLLEKLFALGTIIITTSNRPPKDLYRDGLQRARFLPAIALLNTRLQVMRMDAGVDYRLSLLENSDLFLSPADELAKHSMQTCFNELKIVSEPIDYATQVDIENREITAKQKTEHLIWFEFGELCEGPRSQNDYLQIASEYATVFLENIPFFDGNNDDTARRFINLIDVFYDHGVKLVASAEKPIAELYSGTQLVFEFERTQSRLQEMQTTNYLSRLHS